MTRSYFPPYRFARLPELLSITFTTVFLLFTTTPSLAEITDLDASVEEALSLVPDLERGKQLYHNCALCHTPEGWGTPNGRYPQIAGQHQSVILKQLADIHAGNRDNPTMFPFSESIFATGPQAMADVSAYISRLPMTPNNSVGPGDNLERGKQLYKDNCQKCHCSEGEGDANDYYPRIQGQHFQYLQRQMLWIKEGRRRNADSKMVKQIEGFSLEDISVISDYVSRLKPPKTLLADEADWSNPDFRSGFLTAPKVQKELDEEGK